MARRPTPKDETPGVETPPETPKTIPPPAPTLTEVSEGAPKSGEDAPSDETPAEGTETTPEVPKAPEVAAAPPPEAPKAVGSGAPSSYGGTEKAAPVAEVPADPQFRVERSRAYVGQGIGLYNLNGSMCYLRNGAIVSAATHDLKALVDQGAVLEPL